MKNGAWFHGKPNRQMLTPRYVDRDQVGPDGPEDGPCGMVPLMVSLEWLNRFLSGCDEEDSQNKIRSFMV
jgi:hypothetical protein